MHLILARHGNTFEGNDPVVWVGSANNLPLVKKGFQQAENLARFLTRQPPAAIYTGPLNRTLNYAEVIGKNFQVTPQIDPRLTEIDYGQWTGLTNEQIALKFGTAELDAWNRKSDWPTSGVWVSTEARIIYEVQAFVQDLVRKHASDDTILIVSSNGRLRYFLTLIAGEFEKRKLTGDFKVKTGNICKINYEDGKFQLGYWDVCPD